MAIEYDLVLAGTTPVDEVARRAWPDPDERPVGAEPPLSVDLIERQGFAAFVSAGRNGYFEVLTDTGTWEWEPEAHVSLTFRMDKAADSLWKVNNMLTVVRRVVNSGSEDAIFMFNSDVLLFSRFGGDVVKHRRAAWWDHYAGANEILPG